MSKKQILVITDQAADRGIHGDSAVPQVSAALVSAVRSTVCTGQTAVTIYINSSCGKEEPARFLH